MIEKSAIAVAIGYFYSEKLTDSNHKKTNHDFSKYVGLDTPKETIAVAVSDALGGKARYYGEIANTAEAINKLVNKLCPDGEVVSFCYEAGPCG